jgi:Ser/Thr protein kinase RdoA (MazF antagonist)
MSKKSITRGKSADYSRAAALRFAPAGIASIRQFGSGNVNDTFLVSTGSSKESRFILQRINRHVFPVPRLITQNLRALTDHISMRLKQNPVSGRRWEIPRLLSTSDSSDHWIDPAGFFWRAISFIEDSRSFDTVPDAGHAAEVGFAIGLFHELVSDLPADRLADTLEGFHITPLYLLRYEKVLARFGVPSSTDAGFCTDFIDKRKGLAPVLENAKADGMLPLRIIHGDPKVSNVMIDTRTGLAVSLVDLDTVKPGLVHYDIGDCLRSSCNPLGEDPGAPDRVHFEPELCQALLQGYFSVAKSFLTQYDYELIYDSIRLIAYELGVRFFTDYLEGNVYFKAKDPEHNLRRALVQFRLTASIESQEKLLRAITREGAFSSER